MNRLGFVTGAVILLIGASLAVDLLFDAQVPLARMALATLFIAWGAHTVVRAFARRDHFDANHGR